MSKTEIIIPSAPVAPPQSVDLEEVVLGAMMASEDCIADVTEIITSAGVFYSEAHVKIYQAIYDLYQANKKVDILTVTQELIRKGVLDEVGGALYVSKLLERIGSAAHVTEHAAILQEKYIRRELIRLSHEYQVMAYDEDQDLQDILGHISKSSSDAGDGLFRQFGSGIADAIEESDEITQLINTGHPDSASIPTGYEDIDKMLGGFMPGDLVILAARPSMGKTALALNIANNVAMHGIPVAVFSLEMDRVQLVRRLISGDGRFNNNVFKYPMPVDLMKTYEKSRDRIANLPIYIDDDPRLNHIQFASKARKWVRKLGVKFIVIDYIQLMTARGDFKQNREQEVSTISRHLKITAKELNIPVLALCQMNRGVEARIGTKHRPMLSDLRESGSIEQDSDVVAFLYNPSKYGIHQDDDGNSLDGMTEFIVAKNRNGATFSTYLGFVPEYTQFVNKRDMRHDVMNFVKEEDIPNLRLDLEL